MNLAEAARVLSTGVLSYGPSCLGATCRLVSRRKLPKLRGTANLQVSGCFCGANVRGWTPAKRP